MGQFSWPFHTDEKWLVARRSSGSARHCFKTTCFWNSEWPCSFANQISNLRFGCLKGFRNRLGQVSFHAPNQQRRPNVQCGRQIDDGSQRSALFSTLQLPDVGSVVSAPEPQFLLGKRLTLAHTPQHAAEHLFRTTSAG